jgi:Na+/H+ antiporter NhaD/arsenite permease-like protein
VITLLIFLSTYAIVAAGRVPFLRLDRTGAAIVGAVLMIVTGAIGFDQAVRAVDYRTLVLLFGMMVLVAHLRLAGGLAALVEIVGRRIVHPAALLVTIVAASGVLSALFVNDTICLVFTPLVLDLAAAGGWRPLPFLLALATASNVGGLATMTGNPQNMLIGTASGISFRAFSSALAPVAVLGLVIDAALLCIIFHRDLRQTTTEPAAIAPVPTDRPLLIKTVIVAAGVLAGFLAGYDTALVAAAGAAVLLVTRRVPPAQIYGAIDWDLLMLFIGLFVVIGAVGQAGIDHRLFALLQPLGVQTVVGLTATAAILANTISNVPAVMLFTALVPKLPHPAHAWLVLAMASTLAGNLTLVGSIANLIVVEGAKRRGVTVSFGEYARFGVPVTLATVALGIWWLGAS